MTDKHKDAASTAAYIHGYDLGIADGRRIRDIQQNRIDELEAALEERHRQHLKLELEKRAVEDIAEQFSKDKAEYYRHIMRLEAALKPFADAIEGRCDDDLGLDDKDIWEHDIAENITMGDLRAARAAIVGKDEQNDG